MADYRIPAARHRVETTVSNSRFITTIDVATDVETARTQIAAVRAEMPDANHHVYAFRVGFGDSVIEGMSDDGEPSGTAGPPTLAVLRGADIGDVLVVVTRYFGGTKLGTGGLVRAYSDAARQGLATVPTVLKIARKTIGLETPYNFYQPIRKLIEQSDGQDIDETFAGSITITARFPLSIITALQAQIIDLTSGIVTPFVLGDD